MHRPRRMVGGDVERLEVVPVVLDLGPALHREAGVAEQRLDAAPRAAHRMQAARLLAPARLRDVDAAGRELALEFGLLERRLPLGHDGRERVPRRVDARTRLAALLGSETPERLEQRGHRALLAEQLDLERLDGGEVRAGGNAAARVGEQLVEIDG